MCSIGESCFDNRLPMEATDSKQKSQWQPPYPLPAAFSALLKPGRSAFIGAAAGHAGYAGFSSQPTLPFQAFGGVSGDNSKHIQYGAGAGRLHTNLRCGDVLPITLKFGFFGDISGDGMLNMDDSIIYSREQYPLADSIYRAGLVVKLDSDITSYTQNENMSRITFNETLKFIKNISALADNTSLVVHLVGWQSSGHDTGYPSYDQINPNLGTVADLWRLSAEAKAFNAVLSYHVRIHAIFAGLILFTSPPQVCMCFH